MIGTAMVMATAGGEALPYSVAKFCAVGAQALVPVLSVVSPKNATGTPSEPTVGSAAGVR
jgi:hypothetical protein